MTENSDRMEVALALMKERTMGKEIGISLRNAQEAFRVVAETPLRTQVALFATACHGSQMRTDGPYVAHPLRVGGYVARYAERFEEAWVLAGYLHDTIEDCDVSYDDLLKFFEKHVGDGELGKRVADLVVELTQDKRLERQVRQQKSIEQAADLSIGAKHIKLADVYDNLLALDGLSSQRQQRILRKAGSYSKTLTGTCPKLVELINQRLESLGR